MGKYDDLFYPIPPEYHQWEGYASPRAGFGGNSVMPGSRLYMGFSVSTREGVMEVPHIHHAVDEYLVFTGADLMDFYGSFDAEVEVWIGDDPLRMEKLTITAPTVVRVPPNTWHCPINFKRLGKPVCFIPLYLDGDWSKINRTADPEGRDMFVYDGAGIRRCVRDRSRLCTYCGACFSQAARERPKDGPAPDPLAPYREMEKNPRTGKWDSLVWTLRPEDHPLGEAFISPWGCYPGIEAEKGARTWFSYNLVKQPCRVGEPHMHHAVDQYYFFTGWDLTDPFASFAADIELQVGEDPDHMETHHIEAPTLVRIPPNLWHGPVDFRWTAMPVNFMPCYLDGSMSCITRRVTPEGKKEYLYRGMGLPEA